MRTARHRSLVLPALLLLPALAALLALGTWQVHRLAWKTALLARIAAVEAAPPVPLPAGDAPPEPYEKVRVTGRFRHDREALLGLAVHDTVLGAHLVTPLERGAGQPVLLVDRGWVPLPEQPPAGVDVTRLGPTERPTGEVAVTGYVRPAGGRSWFAAADDPARRRFYSFDPRAIGAALGLPVETRFGLVALAAPGAEADAALPLPARSLPRPPNSHLGYAITWYGLALALVGVFVVRAVSARRRRRSSEEHASP